jgi:DNA-binding transcriptional MocR family regulator
MEAGIEWVMCEDAAPFGLGQPDVSFLPCERLSLHLARAVRTDPASISGYDLSFGHKGLQSELARRMIEAGCQIGPRDIMVTAGATQALFLCLSAVTRPGDAVAVESPGYYGFYALLEHLQLRSVEIPTDPKTGFSVAHLERFLDKRERIKCILLSPNVSNPTGATMPDEEKQRLAGLAARYGIPVVEDDTYGELGTGRQRLRALKSFAPDWVMYVGSMSKVLAPGYRLGWLASGRFFEVTKSHYRMNVFAADLPIQAGIASFLKSGGMTHHLRRMRKRYADQVALFQDRIGRYFPDGVRVGHPCGGHFLWVELPKKMSAVELTKAAVKEKITLAPGILFSSRGHYKRFFRLNCAVPWTKRNEAAFVKLGELASAMV